MQQKSARRANDVGMLVRRIAIALFVLLSMPLAAQAQSYSTYGDWTIACDNVRACTAIGFTAENQSNGFVKITRGGNGTATPIVKLVVVSEGRARMRRLMATFHGGKGGAMPVGPLAAPSDGQYATAIVTGPIAMLFLNEVREATSLTLRLTDMPAALESATVQLDGSAAALLAMDARQHRERTVTAIVARGTLPATAVPPIPAPPLIAALRMTEIPTPETRGPNPVHDADPICASIGEMWLRLSDGTRLRGICALGGAYNTSYRFFFVRGAALVSATFPGQRAGEGAMLTNPVLSRDGRVLVELSKGIGLGTCGDVRDYSWTGAAFVLVRSAEMRDCRGVSSDDWPLVYDARLK